MDGYSSNMRDHMANCCAAHGLSSAGSEQLANYQMPTNPPDQAMMKAFGRSPAQTPYDVPASKNTSASPIRTSSPAQSPYGVPTTENNWDSQPDQKFGTLWSDDTATPAASESTPQGGNVWGPADVPNQGAGNVWGPGDASNQGGGGNAW